MSTFTNRDGSRAQEEDFGVAKISHDSHGFNADQPHRLDTPNIARDAGRGKDVRPVPVHGSMTDRQVGGMHTGGIGHPVTAGGQPGTNPLAPPPQLKRTANVATNSGTRHRGADTPHSGTPGENIARNQGRGADQMLGRAILDAAYAASDRNTRDARHVPADCKTKC